MKGSSQPRAILLSAWRPSTKCARTGNGTSTISRSPGIRSDRAGFFDDLDQYHFEKLHHLLRLVDFDGYRGKAVLEVGCGAAVDLARFAKGGAIVTGVDLAASAIELAKANFAQQGLHGDFRVANGEQLPFADNAFDLVFAHGVVQYTADPQRLVDECRRVLKPGGAGDLSGLQPRSRG